MGGASLELRSGMGAEPEMQRHQHWMGKEVRAPRQHAETERDDLAEDQDAGGEHGLKSKQSGEGVVARARALKTALQGKGCGQQG